MTDRIHAVYELKGETLRSAKRFYNLLQHWHKARPVDWQGKNLLEIGNLYEENFAQFKTLLAEKSPQLLEDLGADQTSIQIRSFTGGLPRAYAESPSCYIAPHAPEKIYIYAPIDYRGRHFQPRDAILLDEAAEKKVGLSLWAGGWSDPITLVSTHRAGTALPADFDPAVHQVLKAPHLGDDPAKPYRFFKAAGETLALLVAQDQAKERYDTAVKQLFRAVEGLKMQLVKAGAIAGPKNGNEVYFNFGLHTDSTGRPKLEISARRKGNGEPYPFLDNAWLVSTGKISGGDYVAPNPATKEGLALQEFFDAIPENPDQAGFPEPLLSTDSIKPADRYDGMFGPLEKPLIRHFPDGAYLAYRVPAEGSSIFTPPGAIEISRAEFLWLDADEADRNTGITPPPRPPMSSTALKGPHHEP